jgi:hypothetical protein
MSRKKFVNKQRTTEKYHSDGILILDSYCFRKWKETIELRAEKLYYQRFLVNETHAEWSATQEKGEIENEYYEGLKELNEKEIVARQVEIREGVEVVIREGYSEEQKRAEIKEYKKPFMNSRIKWSERDEKGRIEWAREAIMCKAWLIEHIESKFHSDVKELKTPKLVFKYCCEVIGKNQLTGEGLLVLFDLVYDDFNDGEPLADICGRMKKNHKRLGDLGFKDEAIIAMLILIKLPTEFEQLSMMLFNQHEPKDITIDLIRDMLEREDNRRNNNQRTKDLEKSKQVEVNNVTEIVTRRIKKLRRRKK